VDDELTPLVYSSPRSWRTAELSVLQKGLAGVEPPPDSALTYQPVAVAGRFVRDGVETRIFAVGDSDFASNRYLRALYNLDLFMNGVHWALERETQIALRPKIRDTVQFPMPAQNSLRMLYGVGLLLPELMLIAAAVVWRRRSGA
jgi:hypothetical protein